LAASTVALDLPTRGSNPRSEACAGRRKRNSKSQADGECDASIPPTLFRRHLNTPGNIFDDKMAVVNASLRGLERGIALPLLLDLARKPVFLHDNSVPSLEALLDPSRGPTAPHPFYLSRQGHRDDIVAFFAV